MGLTAAVSLAVITKFRVFSLGVGYGYAFYFLCDDGRFLCRADLRRGDNSSAYFKSSRGNHLAV